MAELKLFSILLPPPTNTSEMLSDLQCSSCTCWPPWTLFRALKHSTCDLGTTFVPRWCMGLHESNRTEEQPQGKTKIISLFFPLLLLQPQSPSDSWAAAATGSIQSLIFMDTGVWKRQNQAQQTCITHSQSQTVLCSSWMVTNSTLTPGQLQYFIPAVILGWTQL